MLATSFASSSPRTVKGSEARLMWGRWTIRDTSGPFQPNQYVLGTRTLALLPGCHQSLYTTCTWKRGSSSLLPSLWFIKPFIKPSDDHKTFYQRWHFQLTRSCIINLLVVGAEAPRALCSGSLPCRILQLVPSQSPPWRPLEEARAGGRLCKASAACLGCLPQLRRLSHKTTNQGRNCMQVVTLTESSRRFASLGCTSVRGSVSYWSVCWLFWKSTGLPVGNWDRMCMSWLVFPVRSDISDTPVTHLAFR